MVTALIALGDLWAPKIGPSLTLSTLRPALNTFVWIHNVTSGCLGAFILYLLLPRRRGEMIAVVSVGLLIEAALYPSRLDFHKQWVKAVLATGVGIGGTSFVAILLRSVTGRGRERILAGCCLIIAVLFPIGDIAGAWLSQLAHFAQPKVYDTWAYALDCSAGFSPSFILASVVTSSPAASWFFYSVYAHLSLFMVLAASLSLTRGNEDGVYFDAFAAFSISAVAGSLLYNLWPLTGPGNLFGSAFHGDRFIPWNSPPVSLDFRLIEAPLEYSRRAMPSMHATFSLLAALAMMRNRRPSLRVLAWVFFAMTLVSAAYIGHYFIDFVVALPLCLVTLGLAARRQLTTSSARVEAMVLGLTTLGSCYFGFLYGVDFLIANPALVILAQLGIIGGFCWAEGRLARSGRT